MMTTRENSAVHDSEECILGGFRRIAVISSSRQRHVWKAECVEDIHGIAKPGTVVLLKISFVSKESAASEWQRLSHRVAEFAAVSHRNIIRHLGCFREVGGIGGSGELHVVVREFLEGKSLHKRLDEVDKWNAPNRRIIGLDVDEAVDIIRQTAKGLEVLAEHGICHLDVNPVNIFLCPDGTVKLIGFDTAKSMACADAEESNMRGAWNYLAPDFSDGIFSGDEQSDIFSLGVTLHQILTCRLPYGGKISADNQMLAYFERWKNNNACESPIQISHGIPIHGIEDILKTSLERSREVRYKTFSDFLNALDDLKFIEIAHDDRTYRLLRFIGVGSCGRVYKARWMEENRLVALRVMLGTCDGERLRSGFTAMKGISDPCLVQPVDFFEDGFRSILVMDYLEGMPGSSLKDAIRRSCVRGQERGRDGGLFKDEVLAAFANYAHGLSVLHRHDPPIHLAYIKPSDLAFDEYCRGRTAIMVDGSIASRADEGLGATPRCAVDGSLDYMAPEAVMGKPSLSGMAVYSLGLCMYEALTGKPAFPRLEPGNQGIMNLIVRCKEKKSPDFSDPRIESDPELMNLLKRMTEFDPEKRLSDAAQVEEEIHRLNCKIYDYDPIMDELPCLDVELLLEPQKQQARKRRARHVGIVVVCVAVIVVIVCAIVYAIMF